MSAELKPPYEYNREDFYKVINELKPNGACSSQVYNGKIDYKLLNHLDRVKYMSYGVHEWLFKKALDGCEVSLWKINYSYNLYDEVIQKRIEEISNK